jgi:hypothetical protein
MNNGELQLMVPVQTTGQLLHTIRFPTSWQPWGDVMMGVGPLPGLVYDVAAAEIAGNVHYLVATNFGLSHTIRRQSPPSWQPWGDVFKVLGDPGDVHHVAAANVGGDLHVVVELYNGRLLHTIRSSQNPSWQQWGDMKLGVGDPGSVVNVAAAGIGNQLHVVVVRHTPPDTDILHTIRFPTSWQPWGNVEAAAGALPGFLGDISAAAVGGQLHIVTTDGPTLFHTIRFANSWQPWGNVEGVAGELGSFWHLGAANVAGNLHVVASTRAGAGIQTHLFHTIRFTQTLTWQPWGDIEAVVGDPGDVRDFGVA